MKNCSSGSNDTLMKLEVEELFKSPCTAESTQLHNQVMVVDRNHFHPDLVSIEVTFLWHSDRVAEEIILVADSGIQFRKKKRRGASRTSE